MNDLKLPNLILEQPSVPKPPMQYGANQVRPFRPTEHQTRADAPILTMSISTDPMSKLMVTTNLPPHPAMPIGGASAPRLPSQRAGEGDVESAPEIAGNENGGGGLLAFGIDPSSASEAIRVPSGNRYGQFAVAPGTSGRGSPGGVENAAEGGGVGGNGAGGDGSVGVGRGGIGGGGGNSSGAPAFISLKDGEGEPSLSDPGSSAAAQLVFAMPSIPQLRRNNLVVSAGPMGGGGSSVYGALPCGKIYTVFLRTAGKQWSLQYCQKIRASNSTENKARTAVVRTELPIIPPEPEEKFDFRRFPLPPEKAQKSIILRGAIGEDGKVEQVEVYQGLSPVMDAAARLAFSQWKFKPALRDGKPLRVEILVGIPMELSPR